MIVTVPNPVSWLRPTITLRFDTYSWFTMCEVNGIEFHQIGDLPESKLMITLMFGAYVSQCRATARLERYGIKEFYNIWLKLRMQDVEKIKAAIIKSRVLGKSIEEWKGEGEKKK